MGWLRRRLRCVQLNQMDSYAHTGAWHGDWKNWALRPPVNSVYPNAKVGAEVPPQSTGSYACPIAGLRNETKAGGLIDLKAQ